MATWLRVRSVTRSSLDYDPISGYRGARSRRRGTPWPPRKPELGAAAPPGARLRVAAGAKPRRNASSPTRRAAEPYGAAGFFKAADIVRRNVTRGGLEFVAKTQQPDEGPKGFGSTSEVEEKTVGRRAEVTPLGGRRPQRRARVAAAAWPAWSPRAADAENASQLQKFFASSLPNVMVPTRFLVLDTLPTMPSREKPRSSELAPPGGLPAGTPEGGRARPPRYAATGTRRSLRPHDVLGLSAAQVARS